MEPITKSPMPFPGTTTEQMTNSPKSSAPTAPLNFHSTSKLFYCQARLTHGWPCYCYGCPTSSSWWKHTRQWNSNVELLLKVLPKHWTRRQPFPQRHVPNSPTQNHRRFCHCCASRAISSATWCPPGWKRQSQIPSTMWLQSSGKMGMTSPNRMPSAMLHDFYGVN